VFSNSEEHEDEPIGPLEVLPDPDDGDPPLDFESFKDQIDSRGGYVQQLALDISDFQDELDREIALNYFIPFHYLPRPISLLFHSFPRLISLLFHCLPRPISLLFHSLPRSISLLFYSLSLLA
jgi:hypothetical protein